MKKAVYIASALISLAGILCYLLLRFPELIARIDSYPDSINDNFIWYEMAGYIFDACAISVLGILSLMQLKRSTPRLILIFSGAAFFASFGYISDFQLWGFLCLVAGLLPALYEFITYGKLLKGSTFQMQQYGKMLTAAGVMACLCIITGIYSMISSAMFYANKSFPIPPAYYLGIIGIVQSICIAVFCFLRTRRTSVFYRMFFIGPSALGALFFPINITFYLIMYAQPGYFYVDPVYYIGSTISIALVILILSHASKTRHDGILPQESVALPQQHEEMPVL